MGRLQSILCIFIVLGLSLAPAFRINAQESTDKFPLQLEMDLQALLDDSVAEGRAPGVVLCVITPQGTFQGASGWANHAQTQPMLINDAFRVGSITKVFTATMILQLVEAGDLSLDDAVSDILPQMMRNFANSELITVRQLLNHTSGVPEYASSDNFMQLGNEDISRDWSPDELIHLAERQPTQFYPAQGWEYTNTNYILLGMLIETITRQSFAQNLDQRILTPLNMTNTYLAPLDSPPVDVVEGHSSFIDPAIFNPSFVWSAGAVVSNAQDLLIFSQALFAGSLFQQPDTLPMMLDFVTTGRDAETEWGLGVFQQESPLGIYWGHDGALAGYLSTLLYFPDNHITIILLINADGSFWIEPAEIIEILAPYFAEN